MESLEEYEESSDVPDFATIDASSEYRDRTLRYTFLTKCTNEKRGTAYEP